MSKQAPCWVASNTLDEYADNLHIYSGVTRALMDQEDLNLSIDVGDNFDVQANGAIGDQADAISQCSYPYQISLVDPGTGIGDLLNASMDINDIITNVTEGKSLVEQMLYHGFLAPILGTAQAIAKIWGKIADKALGAVAGANGTLFEIAHSEFWFNLLNLVCMGGLRKHKRVMQYVNDLKYPIGLPTPAEAGAAWLANTIDDCTFKTYVMSGDNRFPPYERVVMAGKFKFSALEIMTLYKRKGLLRDDLSTRLRELGSLESEDNAELEKLFEQLPGPADIIRFMVRDTENPDVINTFHTDEQFDENYQGQLKDWAQQQGVSDDIMRREWRAHWGIPSPTQLYEILHRLRHDEEYSGTHDVEGDVRKALIQQDILPYWIDALMKVSYHPLTRTDLNRAFERGWIKEDEYLNGMYNNGYSDDDAQTLLRFARNERLLAIKNSDFGAQYIAGYVSQDQAILMATAEGFDPSMEDQIMEILQPLQQIHLQRKQVDALIHQYKKCWISVEDVRKESENLDIPAQVIEWQLEWAGEDTTCGSKRETASNLCVALEQGIISPSEYVERMRLLKFDEHAIQTYLTLCTNKIRAAQAKRAAQAQAQADKAEKQAEKDAEKAAKDAQAAANRIAKALATAERKRQARNKLLEETANRLGHYLTDAGDPPSTFTTGLYHQVMNTYHLSQDEAANILAMASSKAQGMTSAAFGAWVMELAQASLSEPWLGVFPQFPSPNGAH